MLLSPYVRDLSHHIYWERDKIIISSFKYIKTSNKDKMGCRIGKWEIKNMEIFTIFRDNVKIVDSPNNEFRPPLVTDKYRL